VCVLLKAFYRLKDIRSDLMQSSAEQSDKSSSGDESIWDVGKDPIIETSSLASVTLSHPSYEFPIK